MKVTAKQVYDSNLFRQKETIISVESGEHYEIGASDIVESMDDVEDEDADLEHGQKYFINNFISVFAEVVHANQDMYVFVNPDPYLAYIKELEAIALAYRQSMADMPSSSSYAEEISHINNILKLSENLFKGVKE